MVSPAPTVLVIASGNAGKVREFGALLAGLGLETRPQPEGLEVEETGSTFAENARLKAEAVARATGCWALADDSGLSVDALGGAPGVHSARYADSDAARIERLLQELAAAGAQSATARSAAFTAALALANPRGEIVLHKAFSLPVEPLRNACVPSMSVAENMAQSLTEDFQQQVAWREIASIDT